MSFLDVIHTPVGTLLRALSAVIFLGLIYACQRAIHLRRRRAVILLTVLSALPGALLFCILMGDRDREVYGASLRFHEFELRAYRLPWWAFLAMEAALALLFWLLLRDNLRFSRQNVTPDTIKEAVDLLPVGICFSDGRGEALLANIRMNDACFALTGRPLGNAARFWEAVARSGQAQSGQYLVHMKDQHGEEPHSQSAGKDGLCQPAGAGHQRRQVGLCRQRQGSFEQGCARIDRISENLSGMRRGM